MAAETQSLGLRGSCLRKGGKGSCATLQLGAAGRDLMLLVPVPAWEAVVASSLDCPDPSDIPFPHSQNVTSDPEHSQPCFPGALCYKTGPFADSLLFPAEEQL